MKVNKLLHAKQFSVLWLHIIALHFPPVSVLLYLFVSFNCHFSSGLLDSLVV